MDKRRLFPAAVGAMRAILVGFLLIITGFLSGGCGKTERPDEQTDAASAVTFQMCPSSDGVGDFVKLLGDHGAEEDLNSYYNVTPQDILQDYGFSIFKSDLTCDSLLLYEDKIVPLGECFGGYGATSFAVADLNEDGKFELYFTYSWGSGIHRSQVGCFDFACEEVISFDFVNWYGELLLGTDEDQNLCVYNADYDVKSFVDIEMSAAEKAAYIVGEEEGISLVSLLEDK